MLSPADSIRTPVERQRETVDRIMGKFDTANGGKLLRLFTTRKQVVELCAENRQTLAHVVDKRALLLLLMCIDHTCARSAAAPFGTHGCAFRNAIRKSSECEHESMYRFVKAQIKYYQKLCEEDSMSPAQTYMFHPKLEAETAKEFTDLSESSAEMSVARKFGQVYTSRLKRSSGGLYEIPRDVLLKMEFVKRQNPSRDEAIVLCAYVLNAGRDFRALLGTSHANGMRALARETSPGLVGPGLKDLFQVAIGNTDIDVIAARRELNSHGCT